jgi:hypothetical protein
VSTAVPASSVTLGIVVCTVNVQVPLGNPEAPPAGSTIHPVVPGLVGIVAERVVDSEEPGAKTYQPSSVALSIETLLVVESALPVPELSFQLPLTLLEVLRNTSGVG